MSAFFPQQARIVTRRIDRIAGILAPRTCLFCRAFLSLESGIGACRPCLRTLPSGAAIPNDPADSGMRSFALLEHSGNARALVHRFKINGSAEAEGIFRHLIRGWLAGQKSFTYSTLIPIPSHKAGRAHPHDPSYRAATLLAKLSGARVEPLLLRVRTIPKQSALGRRLRLRAPAGTLKAAMPPDSSRIPRRRALLVDDVRTTGATAREAARLLTAAGFEVVDLFTLSRPRPELEAVRARLR